MMLSALVATIALESWSAGTCTVLTSTIVETVVLACNAQIVIVEEIAVGTALADTTSVTNRANTST